jgi:23S rRNA A2030 N6-methylase RlmJ
MILGFIVSKERKLPDPKKIQAIVNMPPFENPQQIQVFNGMAQFYKCFIKNFVVIMAPITNLTRKGRDFPLERGMLEGLEIDQTKVY